MSGILLPISDRQICVPNSSNAFPPMKENGRSKQRDIDEDSSSSSDDETIDYFTEDISIANQVQERAILDVRDEETADHWVERNPLLVRLTGKHPFNSEPPLKLLVDQGFITPASLHFVRNHGPAFKGSWEGWTVEVSGLVKRPRSFTLDELVSDFPQREFPVTISCAGNRRKEQNMKKQTIGFNWGPAVVSTSVWKGVPLHYVLKRCGIYSRGMGALNVCFEGAEDLPGNGGTKYGTSIKTEIAMDPASDVILAYMQNGKPLLPDHGFPVRLIVPGFIGGRMVKWLKRITVTPQESDNYYHYRDNRFLPSHVDTELADAEGWWYKPEYLITEVNINSVIATPSHGEVLQVSPSLVKMQYKLKGYAFSGGGKKVTRVEVSLDGGETWRQSSIERREKPNKYGRYWCWCLWSADIQVMDLVKAKEVAVRAWDSSLNTQPSSIIWNVMGFMNNSWYRVRIITSYSNDGGICVTFEHPVQPGNNGGGWLEKEKKVTGGEGKQSTRFNLLQKQFTMEEVRKHRSTESPWIVVRGGVYDCGGFLKDHPGGADSILINDGKDCTEEFEAIHSERAHKLLADFKIGELAASDHSPDSSSSLPELSMVTNPARISALFPGQKLPCELVSKVSISHNVRLFRFQLPLANQQLGLPVGKHIFLCATINGKLVMRPYTPTTAVDELGYFELVIKIYFKGVNPRNPHGGLMSQHLDSLPMGSVLDIKGPVGNIEYCGRGNWIVHGRTRFGTKLAMIAGGTGITPIFKVMQAILKDPQDNTDMHLVYVKLVTPQISIH